jgi:uncharacterized protein YbjT (DUF2867 family)
MPIESARKRVLVAGATGRMSVVVDTLLARGHVVRAMTRNPESPSALRLRGAGVEVVFGDFDDPTSIHRAAREVDALFATGTAHKAGPEGELRHGRNLATAAAAAGVPQLVYCSGDGAAPDSPLPLFRVKYQVEEHIRSLPIDHTIIAPVYFMENLFNPWNLPVLHAGKFPSPIPVNVLLQQVAIADIASLATLAIERPDDFSKQRITIASDELAATEAAEALSLIAGRRFEATQLGTGNLSPALRALFDWLERVGHNGDIGALHARYPDVGWQTYENWLQSQRTKLAAFCPHEYAPA